MQDKKEILAIISKQVLEYFDTNTNIENGQIVTSDELVNVFANDLKSSLSTVERCVAKLMIYFSRENAYNVIKSYYEGGDQEEIRRQFEMLSKVHDEFFNYCHRGEIKVYLEKFDVTFDDFFYGVYEIRQLIDLWLYAVEPKPLSYLDKEIKQDSMPFVFRQCCEYGNAVSREILKHYNLESIDKEKIIEFLEKKYG